MTTVRPLALHMPQTRMLALPVLPLARLSHPFFFCAGAYLPITDAIGRDVCRNKFALNVRRPAAGCRVSVSARRTRDR